MRRLAKLAVAALLLFVPANVFSCGPFFDEVIFTYSKHPDLPLKDYAAGKLGIVAPTYARSYLYVAYQYLSGRSFATAQQNKLVDFWHSRFSYWPSNAKDSPDGRYFELRKRYAPNPPKPPAVYVTVRRFYSAVNCNPDAFVTAAQTLEDRARKFGENSEAFRDWLAGQDAVFQNCPGDDGGVLPKPVSTNAPALLRADRDYQLAAAHFYSGKLDAAQAAFSRIAQDRGSPWSRIAPYLRLRTMIRKAGMAEHNEAALLAAEKEIDSYLRDRSHAYFRNDAVLLRGYIEVRLHPESRMMELLRILRDPRDPNLWQDLWDVLVLVDRMEGEDVWERSPATATRLMARSRKARASSDMLDWIINYQSMTPDAARHALAKWRSENSNAWLLSAISKVAPDSPDAAALIEAATKLAPDSPAFATASYHAVRLLAASKQFDAARARLSSLPANPAMPASAANAFTAQRAALAVTFDDFLEHASAIPAAVLIDDGDEELPTAWDEKREISSIAPRPAGARLPAESAAIFNLHLPLQLWVQASEQGKLPVEIRRDLVLAAWTRAVLLSDHATARNLAPEAGRMFPALAQQMQEYAASEASAPDASLLLLLRYPGFRPYVSPDQRGRGRFEEESDQSAGALALERMDSYHDNWWCEDLGAKLVVDYREDKPDDGKPRPDPPSPQFLSNADRQLAAEQWKRLHAVGAAPEYLLRATLAWARRSPNDSRVPEALSRAIRAGHLGCADKTSTALSKQAFQLLHRRYPKTAWAKKTPYYY